MYDSGFLKKYFSEFTDNSSHKQTNLYHVTELLKWGFMDKKRPILPLFLKNAAYMPKLANGY